MVYSQYLKKDVSVVRVVFEFYPLKGGSVTHVIELSQKIHPYLKNQIIIAPDFGDGCKEFDKKFKVPHFEYINKTSLGDYHEDQRYQLTSTLGRISYPELHPKYEEHWRFTPDDFCMLEKDNTVLRIYNNGNLNIYFVD